MENRHFDDLAATPSFRSGRRHFALSFLLSYYGGLGSLIRSGDYD